MSDNNRNQASNVDQDSNENSQQQGQGNNSTKQDAEFDNPQEGRKWDNYQTRTLSSDYNEDDTTQNTGTSASDTSSQSDNLSSQERHS